jgi:hypothetical protein
MAEGSLTMVYFEYLPLFNPFAIRKQKQSHWETQSKNSKSLINEDGHLPQSLFSIIEEIYLNPMQSIHQTMRLFWKYRDLGKVEIAGFPISPWFDWINLRFKLFFFFFFEILEMPKWFKLETQEETWERIKSWRKGIIKTFYWTRNSNLVLIPRKLSVFSWSRFLSIKIQDKSKPQNKIWKEITGPERNYLHYVRIFVAE